MSMRKSLMRWIMITITIVVIMCITNINKTLYTVQAKTSGEEASLESVNIRNITLGSTIYGGLTGNEDYEDIIYKFTTSTSGKLNITTTTDFDGLRFTILDSNGEDLLFSSEEFYYNDTLGTGTGFILIILVLGHIIYKYLHGMGMLRIFPLFHIV